MTLSSSNHGSSSLAAGEEHGPVPPETPERPKQRERSPGSSDNRNRASLIAILGFVTVLLILGGIGFTEGLIPTVADWESALLAADPLFWGMAAPVLWIALAAALQWYYRGYADAAARVSPMLRTPIGAVPFRYAVVILLLPVRYTTGPLDLDLSFLTLPYAAWLGHRFGKPAITTVAWAGTPMFIGIGFAGLSHKFMPELYFASLIICRLCANRDLLMRGLYTRYLTSRQLAVLGLLLTLTITYSLAMGGVSVVLGVDFRALFCLSFFFLGLSAIPPRRYLTMLGVIGLIGIPLTVLGVTGLTFAGIGINIAPVGQPYYALICFSLFAFGRMVRHIALGGGSPAGEQRWTTLASLLLLLILSHLAVWLDFNMDLGSGRFHGSLRISSDTLFLLAGFLLGAVFQRRGFWPMTVTAILFQVAYPLIVSMEAGFIRVGGIPQIGEFVVSPRHWITDITSLLALPVFWYFGLRVRSGVEAIGRQRSYPKSRSHGEDLPILSSPAIPLWVLIAAAMALSLPMIMAIARVT